ncbi:MAG: hypothetical protein U9R25_12410 [Chloroflexota bacterium]|nr:hypothetical protein [Chloroflexota bacterium]
MLLKRLKHALGIEDPEPADDREAAAIELYGRVQAFVDTLHPVESAPVGNYAMGWMTDPGTSLAESGCLQLWDQIYHAADGVETWLVARMLRAAGGIGNEIDRMSYPQELVIFPLQGPDRQMLVMSLSQEKGIRFHFDSEGCDPAYRDQFLEEYLDFVRAVRAGADLFEAELDGPREPRALTWWQQVMDELTSLEDDRDAVQAVGTIVIGNRKGFGLRRREG